MGVDLPIDRRYYEQAEKKNTKHPTKVKTMIKRNKDGQQNLASLRAKLKESVNVRMRNVDGNWIISDNYGEQKYPRRYSERAVLQLALFGQTESLQEAREMITFQKHLSF